MNATTYRCQYGAAMNITVRFIFCSPLALAIKQNPAAESPATAPHSGPDDLDPIVLPISSPTRRAKGWLPAARTPNGKTHRTPGQMPGRLKPVEFQFAAPLARSVKLAADFTDWDRFPVEMIQSADGIWWAIVPLLPGKYGYRFIVDGQWCDDPQNIRRVRNSFGTSNAVVQVT